MVGQSYLLALTEAAPILSRELLELGTSPRAAVKGIHSSLAEMVEDFLGAGKAEDFLLLTAVE
jgi:hypothetical protein